jgi:DNA-binding NarL/FixJ family response regulator
MTFRVLIAEDQTMVREALAALLALEEDIEIVAEASHGDEVVPAALDVLPDVALLDIEMPGGDGLSAAAALRDCLPSCRVLILTTFGRAGYLRRAMESGAVGFLPLRRHRAQLPLHRHQETRSTQSRGGGASGRTAGLAVAEEALALSFVRLADVKDF